MSADEGVTWADLTLDQPEGFDGTYYRYSGSGSIVNATVDELLWKVTTTNDVEMQFHAIGLIGDM